MKDFVNSKLIPDMRKTIETTFKSVKSQLKQSKASFEIFGFDFLVDSEYETWLLEVNTNPCLEESNLWLEKLVPRAINDALKLTIDQVFQ